MKLQIPFSTAVGIPTTKRSTCEELILRLSGKVHGAMIEQGAPYDSVEDEKRRIDETGELLKHLINTVKHYYIGTKYSPECPTEWKEVEIA